MTITIIIYIDCVSTDTRVQGDRQIHTTVQQLFPEPQEDILPFSNTQDNPQSAITVQHREDFEEDLSDDCQQVDRSSNGELVITPSTFFIKPSLGVCKSSEQVKKENDDKPEKEKVDEVFGPTLVCFSHLDQAKDGRNYFLQCPLPFKVFLKSHVTYHNNVKLISDAPSAAMCIC